MLDIRPNCENCNTSLPPDSTQAMICSYECTFCQHCVDTVIENVCPNCGGGFCQRPIRPSQEWQSGVSLTHQPAQTSPVLKPVDIKQHRTFSAEIKLLLANKR